MNWQFISKYNSLDSDIEKEITFNNEGIGIQSLLPQKISNNLPNGPYRILKIIGSFEIYSTGEEPRHDDKFYIQVNNVSGMFYKSFINLSGDTGGGEWGLKTIRNDGFYLGRIAWFMNGCFYFECTLTAFPLNIQSRVISTYTSSNNSIIGFEGHGLISKNNKIKSSLASISSWDFLRITDRSRTRKVKQFFVHISGLR